MRIGIDARELCGRADRRRPLPGRAAAASGAARPRRDGTSSCSTRRTPLAHPPGHDAAFRHARRRRVGGTLVGAGAAAARGRRAITSTSASRRPTRRRSASPCRWSWRSTTCRSSRTRSGFALREGAAAAWLTRQSAQTARAVMTISEFSRRELIERLGRAGRADSRHSARQWRPDTAAQRPRPRRPATGPHVLYVGSIFNRRHVPDLIRAFAPTRAPRVRTLSLDIVGDNRSYPREDLPARDCRAKASKARARGIGT